MLSEEQKQLIITAEEGRNILVDACIGSGKTTTIQALCDASVEKRILYLTYNKLLKLDAKERIRNHNVFVQNYHGFAYYCLARFSDVSCGQGELIQNFLRTFKEASPKDSVLRNFDMLVLDEYQDLDEELAQMLMIIKEKNPKIQIVAVGDMQQKIYDRTTLDVPAFMNQFLDSYEKIAFTQCFRLSPSIASKLGRIWKKEIKGVNSSCQVLEMSRAEITSYLAKQDPSDVLCLGSRTGQMMDVLNDLEEEYPQKFNKQTVYASISDQDKGVITPNSSSAIFTTYDASKGMERKICVVFDYTNDYWKMRNEKPMSHYEINRNIFCVAASRGKQAIIFVHGSQKSAGKKRDIKLLSEEKLSSPMQTNTAFHEPFDMSTMFAFNYTEDVEACFSLLKTRPLEMLEDDIIQVNRKDGMIDLAPCFGIYQEAMFFQNYDIDEVMAQTQALHKDRIMKRVYDDNIEKKILSLTAFETMQDRYFSQVSLPFVSKEQHIRIKERLRTMFTGEEEVQTSCELLFPHNVVCKGRTDVIKNEVVYELKFVSELSHEHYLQCASYMVALHKKIGVLWNVYDNTMVEITIPDEKAFLSAVMKSITKGAFTEKKEPLVIEETKILPPISFLKPVTKPKKSRSKIAKAEALLKRNKNPYFHS